MFAPGFSHENLEISFRISRVAQHVPTNRTVAETDSSQVFQRVQKLFCSLWIDSIFNRSYGRTIAWLWPSGTEASLTVLCRGTDGCLTVKAKAPKKQ